MKTIWALVCLLMLVGCTMRFEVSVLKQLDRPAERTTIEDTSYNVKQPPRTTVETQDPVVVTPTSPRENSTLPVPQIYQQIPPQKKPMSYEVVPDFIIPEKSAPIKYMYLHRHRDQKRACYVRTAMGMYVSNHMP